MGLNLRMFGSSVSVDYSGSHLHTFKPLPDDLIELFEFWLSEQEHADAAQVDVPDARYPMLIASAVDHYDRIRQHADPNREILEPELVRAVDDLSWNVGQAMQSYEFSKAPWAQDRVRYFDAALAQAVHGWLQFAEAFREHGDASWLEVMDLEKSAAAEHSANAGSAARLLWRIR